MTTFLTHDFGFVVLRVAVDFVILGGLLLLLVTGAGAISFDAWLF